MLAWILKTKPVILGSAGSTMRVSVGSRARRGGYAHEAFEQLAHAEVVDRRTEEYRGQFAPQIGVTVEIVVNALDQLDVRAQLGREFVADLGLQLRRGEV